MASGVKGQGGSRMRWGCCDIWLKHISSVVSITRTDAILNLGGRGYSGACWPYYGP